MRIKYTLFISLLLTSLISVLILAVFMQWNMGRGMLQYLNDREAQLLQPVIKNLAIRYQLNGASWQWLSNNPELLDEIIVNNRPRHPAPPDCPENDCAPPPRPNGPRAHRPPPPDVALLDEGGTRLVSLNLHAEQRTRLPITVNEKTVGWISVPIRRHISEGIELVFIKQQQNALLWMSLVALLLAAIIAFPLARYFVRPIEKLKQGTQQLTLRDYSLNLADDRHDEIGLLARDFNLLSKTLASHEIARNRWFADISHELRTPVAILKGELEAMLDGIRPMTHASLESLSDEVDQLNQLINDLYELAKADSGALTYHKEQVDVYKLLEQKVQLYQAAFDDKEVEISLMSKPTDTNMLADRTRLNQLFDNLINNSLRYTDTGGQLTILVNASDSQLIIAFVDSAPGVEDVELEKMFDYLYRSEQSRNRELGGSGLGLAICQRIVKAHDGNIVAKHSAIGGVSIEIEFNKS